MSASGMRAAIFAPLVIVLGVSAPAVADHDLCHGSGTVTSLLGGAIGAVEDTVSLGLCEPAPTPTPTPTPTASPEPRPTRAPDTAPPRDRAANGDAPDSPPREAAGPVGDDAPVPPARRVVTAGRPAPVDSAAPQPLEVPARAAGWSTPSAAAGVVAALVLGIVIGARRGERRARRTAMRDLGRVLDVVPDAVIVLGPDLRVRARNAAAAALAGARDKTLPAVLAGTTDDGIWLPTWVRATAGREARAVATLRSGAPVAVSVVPVAGGGTACVVRDLRPERALDTMKREFLANVGHELRTPLTSALGFARILRDRRLEPEQERTFVSAVIGACEKLDRVVDLLVDVASIEGGAVGAPTDEVVLAELVEGVRARWADLAPSHVIATHIPKRPVAVRGNESLLRHALHELVDNAVKFSPGGGVVTIDVRSAVSDGARALRLAVSDQGVGIEPAARARLFDDFTQADGSETRAFGGLGLGLAFVRRVARLHEGTVALASEPGAGTTVTIEMPLVSVPRTTPAFAGRRAR